MSRRSQSVEDPGESTTLYALVVRHPYGGYAVLAGIVEDDETPAVDPDNDHAYLTLQSAVDFARTAGYYSVDPGVYRAPTRIVKGV